jgi:hypothetical protein
LEETGGQFFLEGVGLDGELLGGVADLGVLLVGEFHEVGDFFDVGVESAGALFPQVLVVPAAAHFVEFFVDSAAHEVAVGEALVANSLREHFVEVEFILDEEGDRTGVEHEVALLLHEIGVLEGVEVEGPHEVPHLATVPRVGGNPNLKSVHPLAIELQLLILHLLSIKVMGLILIAHSEA